MSKVTREVRINAPKEKVWDILADFGDISVFNPSVPNSYLTNDQNGGVGSQRHCDLAASGASIEERIVEWVDGEKMVIEIYEGKKTPPFKTAFASISVHEAGPNASIVRGTLDYTLKFGPLGALMDMALVKPQFGKAWEGLFAGLKHYAETGQAVDGLKGLDFSSVQVVPA
ncbi:MAG: SRPBCC family protein [Chloroflexota bacterium]